MEQDQRTYLRSIHELIKFGQYVAAGERLQKLRDATPESVALRQLLALDVGEHLTAHETAIGLLGQCRSHRVQVLCLSVIGRVDCLEGRHDQGIGRLRQALVLANDLNDPVLVAWTQGRLSHTLLRSVNIESALPELARLRASGYAAGDPHTIAQFHCDVAEIEMRQGRHSGAAKHLGIAASLCQAEDVRMTAQIGRLRANGAMLSSKPFDARRLIEPVIELLEQSGARFPLMASLSTLAEACLQMGAFDMAETALNRMLNVRPANHARLAMLDSLMRVALGRRNRSEASRIEREILPLLQLTGVDYYSLTHIPTRARWLITEGRSAEALELLRGLEPSAARTAVSRLTQAFGFAEVETLVAMNAPVLAAARLRRTAASSRETSLEDVAEINRLAALTQSAPRNSLARRAERVRSIAFSTDGGHHSSFTNAPTLNSPLEILYSVATLFSVPLNGEVLAHEIVALLRATGTVDEALIATEPPAHEGIAFVPPCTTNANQIVIEAGSDGHSRYAVSATPTDRPEAYLALLAVQDLVRSAMALGDARDRERAEPSPWLPDPYCQDTGIVVATNNMRELLSITRRVATSNVNVLFTGETGTGKELFAKALHESSGRREKPFVPFNCTTVSRDMVDSQLFGYRRGAFTGAHDAFPGVIRAAAGGTLFLDEIGEISLDVQPKLLRFLESGEIHPLGEPKPITVDVRVVAATNAKLEDLVAQGRFREDLFYRLNVVRLQVPPLRERREEIPLLVEHFLDKFSRESQKTGIRAAEETMEYLILFKWPGNVRQLANEVRRMVALTESGAVLMPEHLSSDIAASRRTVPPSQRDPAPTEFTVRVDQPISAAIEHVERSMIKYALEIAGNRLEDAAQMLGLSRKGLYLKRQRLKMVDASLRPEDVGKAAS